MVLFPAGPLGPASSLAQPSRKARHHLSQSRRASQGQRLDCALASRCRRGGAKLGVMASPTLDRNGIARLIAWQVEAGADEAILETSVDRYRVSAAPVAK